MGLFVRLSSASPRVGILCPNGPATRGRPLLSSRRTSRVGLDLNQTPSRPTAGTGHLVLAPPAASSERAAAVSCKAATDQQELIPDASVEEAPQQLWVWKVRTGALLLVRPIQTPPASVVGACHSRWLVGALPHAVEAG